MPDEWKDTRESALCDVTKVTPVMWPRLEAVSSQVLVPLSETTLFSSSHVAKNLYFWQEAINRGLNTLFSVDPWRFEIINCVSWHPQRPKKYREFNS